MTWLLFIVCLAVSFIFSGTEAGLLSLNRLRLRQLSRSGDAHAVRLWRLVEEPSRLFITVLCVTGLANIIAILILVSWFVHVLKGWGYLCTILVAFPIFLIVTEMLPKSFFRRFPYQALASIAVLVEIASLLLTPLMAVGSWCAVHIFRLKRPQEVFVAREDLKSVTRQVEKMGMLSSMERQMIHNVVDFRTVRVKDVMLKSDRVVALRIGTPVEEVIKTFLQTRFDSLPLANDRGEIVGLVNAFDVILGKKPGENADAYLHRMLVVREDEPASMALHRLRAAFPQTLALVVDGEDHTTGVVGIEDLLGPLVKTVA
jgi:CBS domain containing-hemolysin-like protein